MALDVCHQQGKGFRTASLPETHPLLCLCSPDPCIKPTEMLASTQHNDAGGSWFRACCWGRGWNPSIPWDLTESASLQVVYLYCKHCSCYLWRTTAVWNPAVSFNSPFKFHFLGTFPPHGTTFCCCWVSIQPIWAPGLAFFLPSLNA